MVSRYSAQDRIEQAAAIELATAQPRVIEPPGAAAAIVQAQRIELGAALIAQKRPIAAELRAAAAAVVPPCVVPP